MLKKWMQEEEDRADRINNCLEALKARGQSIEDVIETKMGRCSECGCPKWNVWVDEALYVEVRCSHCGWGHDDASEHLAASGEDLSELERYAPGQAVWILQEGVKVKTNGDLEEARKSGLVRPAVVVSSEKGCLGWEYGLTLGDMVGDEALSLPEDRLLWREEPKEPVQKTKITDFVK